MKFSIFSTNGTYGKPVLSLALLLLFFTAVVGCSDTIRSGQQNDNGVLVHEAIKLDTDKIFEKIVKIRRDLHEYPELAGKEKRTQEVIKKHLLELGLDVEMDTYGYSIIGILKGGKKGKKIAWRADMDALPNDFPDDVDFKSKIKGVQHGCGHDVHLAIALGIAEVMAKNKKALRGTVYFIFQPEEEPFTGAKGMVDRGLFSKIHPDEIYSLHVTPLSVGQIMVKPNEVYTYQKRVQVALKNSLSQDDATKLTNILSKSVFRIQDGTNPWELKNLIDPEIGLANPNTIFKDYQINEGFSHYTQDNTLFIEGNVYETNAANLSNIIPKIKQVIGNTNYKDQLLSVSFTRENPNVVNDPNLTTASVQVLERVYGKGLITSGYGQVPFSNDDFAYFQQKVPGVYFFLGGSNFEKGIIAMIHAPNFKVDEECIRIGIKSFSSLIYERQKIGY
jgi:metal-dependent amidase/aminoacylase/carboxypeptidase family protein